MRRLQRTLSRVFNLSQASTPKVVSPVRTDTVHPTAATMSKTGDLSLPPPIPSKPTTPRPAGHPAASLHKTVPLSTSTEAQPRIENFKVPVNDGFKGHAHGLLHLPSDSAHFSRTAAILLSGAGGGVVGPSAMYLSLAATLPILSSSSGGIPVLRLDYRYPARTTPCVADVKAAMSYLARECGTEQFVLVGWSFGGAPVFTLAGSDDRIIGVATVASQTADAMEGAKGAGRRGIPALLLHGTGDRTLSDRCSRNLQDAWLYGHAARSGTADEGEEEIVELVLFEGDDHSLTGHAAEAARLVGEFIVKCAGGLVNKQDDTILSAGALENKDVIEEIMVKGGDLRGNEKLE